MRHPQENTDYRWNYRVIEVKHEGGRITRGIHEVYYINDEPSGLAEEAVTLCVEPGPTAMGNAGFLQLLEQVARALKLPVLRPQQFKLAPSNRKQEMDALFNRLREQDLPR